MCRRADQPGSLGYPPSHKSALAGAQQTLPVASVHAVLAPGLAEIPPTSQDSSSPAIGWANLGPGLDGVREAVPGYLQFRGSVPERVSRGQCPALGGYGGGLQGKEKGLGQPGGSQLPGETR